MNAPKVTAVMKFVKKFAIEFSVMMAIAFAVVFVFDAILPESPLWIQCLTTVVVGALVVHLIER